MTKPPTRTSPHEDQTPEQPAPSQPAAKGLWRKLFTRGGLAVLLCLSLVVHLASLSYFRIRLANSEPAAGDAEISLGDFHFLADRTEGGRVAKAEFALHAALADPADRAGRHLLATYRYRIQQAIEELLRRAHGGDFDDPVLAELKRKIEDRVNENVGQRLVSDVIITDLKVHWNAPETKSASDLAAE